MHHVLTLKAFKVATQLQWTGPIIDTKEHCFGVVVVHLVTKQTIMQYSHLKDLGYWHLARKSIASPKENRVSPKLTTPSSSFPTIKFVISPTTEW
jgi:hypothetical protein